MLSNKQLQGCAGRAGIERALSSVAYWLAAVHAGAVDSVDSVDC